MDEQLMRMQTALVARMHELGAGPTDERVRPLINQMQALLQQRVAAAVANGNVVQFGHSSANAVLSEPEGASMHAISDYRLRQPIADLVDAYLKVARPASPFVPVAALKACEEGRHILALAPVDKAEVATHAYAAWCTGNRHGPDAGALRRLVSDLLRSALDFTEAQVLALVKAAVREGLDYVSYSPNQAVMTALERHVEAHGLSPDLRGALSGLRARMVLSRAGDNAEGRKLRAAVDAMLARPEQSGSQTEPRFVAKPDSWGRAVAAWLAKLGPQKRARLDGILMLAAKGGENSKPNKGWLKLAQESLGQDDRLEIGEMLGQIVALHEPGSPLDLANQNALRGLVWLVAIAAPDVAAPDIAAPHGAAPPGAARALEAYAKKCLTFSSAHFAYLSLVLGNAAVHAFSLLPGTSGAASLARLRRHLKRPGEVKAIEKALAALALARGMTAADLEEISLPDFGFDGGGNLEISVGPATAVLNITEMCELETHWRGADGHWLKSPPSAVKEQHADALKVFKSQIKEIDETLRAQRLRLERIYLANRNWSPETWRTRYLDEPLVAGLTRRLIWSFEADGQWVEALPHQDDFIDAAGTSLDLAQAARVKLWHPMQSTPDRVLAWRRRLQIAAVTQPFKQAHREIYVLTDAERVTNFYSNRFAGHVVDQHRLRALAQARGWNCPTFGMWDAGDGRPHKRLPDRSLQIEFWADPIESAVNRESFQYRYLSTDQVRFTNLDGAPIPLENVDAALFSELMRDVDLFVSVAGVGNDPSWADQGDGRFAAYWTEAAFGALTETGRTRHAALKDLLPGLAIASRCRFEERYLVVEGRIRTYRIHLGSGNIQMEPNSQYLCIVQDRQNNGANVRLPFEGDMTLSVILSKAFMLVEDDKIKDPSIRSQIMNENRDLR